MGDKRTKRKRMLSALIGVIIVLLAITNAVAASTEGIVKNNVNNAQSASEQMVIPGLSPGVYLSPATATRDVGTSHVLTATLINSDSNPQCCYYILFTITGPNAGSAEAMTDANGVATYDYVGTNAGTDTIVATSGYMTSPAVKVNWVLPAPPQLDLTPATATNDIGTSHKLTAKLLDGSKKPIPGQTITFTVTAGPHKGTSGTGTTNSAGIATWSYTGTKVGTDTIVATGYDQTSAYVSKTWIQPLLPTLSLSPAKATSDTGISYKLAAKLVDGSGTPISSQTITFTVTAGPHKGTSGTGTTNSAGIATWSYTGTKVGTDTIVATGYGQSSSAVSKIWKQPLPSTLSLTPATATGDIGISHKLTVKLTNGSGAPVSGQVITFTVTAGPHKGKSGTGTTSNTGVATWSYTGTAAGIDSIQASATVGGAKVLSNTVEKEWTLPVGDILAYYRGLGVYPNIVETSDLLKAANDWRDGIIPPGFYVSLTTPQLLTLANEWRTS